MMSNGISNVAHTLRDTQKVRWFDWTFYGILAALCIWLFCHGDLSITVWHSYDLLSAIKNGNFFSFYQIVLDKALAGGYFGVAQASYAANYNILIYLVLAIWLLPVKIVCYLFHLSPSTLVLSMYSKHLILLVALASGYILYKIGIKFGLEAERSKWLALVFLGSPILLFGSTLFGQLDIFNVFLILLALWFYLDGRYYWFSAIMSLAVCFKLFAVLAFIPLILLVEKRILHIIKYGLIGASLLLITRLLAALDPGYSATQEAMSEIYNFADRLIIKRLPTFHAGSSAFVVFFLLICFWCYIARPKADDIKNWAVCIPMLAYTVLFSFISSWHPQWIILLCPFAALAIMLIKDAKAAMLIDCGIQLGYILYTPLYFKNNVDFSMMNRGILPRLFGQDFVNYPVSNLFGKQAELVTIVSSSLFVACMAALAVFAIIRLLGKRGVNIPDESPALERSVVWLRMSILLVFIVPGVLWYIKQVFINP